jgi:hypothetical protein
MTEEHKQKIRKTHLRLWHGENWTEEDQKEFEKERNRRQCLNHRNKHRDEYTSYQLEYQRRYREKNKFYYRVYTVESLTPRQPNELGRIHKLSQRKRRK